MPKDLGQLRQAYTHPVLLAGRRRRAANAAVEAHGISDATALPLILIGRMDGEPRQNALAEAMGIEGPFLVRLLDRLGAVGLIVRKEDPTDRRAKMLNLTLAGKAVVARMEADLARLREKAFANVSTADLQASLCVFQAVQDYGREVPDVNAK